MSRVPLAKTKNGGYQLAYYTAGSIRQARKDSLGGSRRTEWHDACVCLRALALNLWALGIIDGWAYLLPAQRFFYKERALGGWESAAARRWALGRMKHWSRR